jgi:tetratricopeptide (TPR) repeat protein
MASKSEPEGPSPAAGLVPAPEPTPALAHRSDYRLVRTLLALQHAAATGMLRVESEGIVTIVHIRAGHPVFVEGGLPADSLGRLLVRRGTISESTLAMVEEERMLMQGRMRFGEVALRLGVLKTDALRHALREQVRGKLARCLHWERTQHVFVTGDIKHEPLPDGPLAMEPLLLYGVTHHYSLERIRQLLGPVLLSPVELWATRDEIEARLELDERGKRLLAFAHTACSVDELLRGSGPEQLQIGQLLTALALFDQLRMPEPEAPEKSGPFVIDELPRAGRARGSLRPSAGPDDSGPVSSMDAASVAAHAKQPPFGASVDLPGKEKLLADSAFLQGKELLRAGEYGAAADAFREASNLRPTALEYALFAAWSAYLSMGRVGKWREMLVELCERTLSQDRHLAFAHHVRGQLALETKDVGTAREALGRALELDPDDEEARRLLERCLN